MLFIWCLVFSPRRLSPTGSQWLWLRRRLQGLRGFPSCPHRSKPRRHVWASAAKIKRIQDCWWFLLDRAAKCHSLSDLPVWQGLDAQQSYTIAISITFFCNPMLNNSISFLFLSVHRFMRYRLQCRWKRTRRKPRQIWNQSSTCLQMMGRNLMMVRLNCCRGNFITSYFKTDCWVNPSAHRSCFQYLQTTWPLQIYSALLTTSIIQFSCCSQGLG